MKKILLLLIVLVSLQIQAQEIYNRVVSLAPSFSKSIYYLEAQDQLVGCTNYCTIAKEDGKPVVASPMVVSIEKVLSVKPDLVIASGITNPEHLETLKKFDIAVEVMDYPHSYAEICDQYIRLGQLLGKEENAHEKVAEINRQIDLIKTKVENTDNHEKLFFQIGADPLYTVIPDTFMDDYITLLQADNVASDLTKGSVSREWVIKQQPDYIFIATMGIVGDDEKDIWSSFEDIPATKDGNIFIIDSDLACTPTPQTFVQTLEIMYNILYDKH